MLHVDKLSAYGILNTEHECFSNYLSNRMQRVSINNIYSDWTSVSRALQGSILGPLLFLVFMNDLPAILTSYTINIYTDNTTIYYGNRNPDSVIRVIDQH